MRFCFCLFIAHFILRIYNMDEDIFMKTLREVRKELGLTQIEAAKVAKVSRRTYQSYESIDTNNPEELNGFYEYIKSLLEGYQVDEDHGYVTLKQIKNAAVHIFRQHQQVECAYLFGSYARNEPKPTSDVDILVIIKGTMGMEYYGMAGELQEFLHKRIDIVSLHQVVSSEPFLERLLREGVKIYGQGINRFEN